MKIDIYALRASVPVTPRYPPKVKWRGDSKLQTNTVELEIYSECLRLWDHATFTGHGADTYGFEPGKRTFDGRLITDMPYFREVFRHLAEQRAANRTNAVGAFLSAAVDAMEAGLAARDGSSVYFASAGSRIKIGWSKQVGTRIAQLQTGNPDPIKLLGTVPGGRAKEGQIQRQFAHARVHGEWFEATPDLLEFIGSAT